MTRIRRNLGWLSMLLATGLVFCLWPTSTEAQIFSRLRASCRPRLLSCDPCSPRICPSHPLPAFQVCQPAVVGQSHSIMGEEPSSDCGTCRYFYDQRERRWFYLSVDCVGDCVCLLPVETGTLVAKSTGIVEVDCEPGIPPGKTGFELTLQMRRGVEQRFRFVLPAGTDKLGLHKYQFEVMAGVHWLIEVSYDNTSSVEDKPMSVPPMDPQNSGITYSGPGIAYTHEYPHDPAVTSSVRYQFNGFDVKVVRENLSP